MRKERTALTAQLARNATLEAEAIARLAKGAHRDERTGCLLWYAPRNHRGYGTITFGGETWFTHRLSFVAHNGPVPIGMFVCHRCDNPACIAIEHLFLGTPQENTDDAKAKGRLRWRASRLDPKLVGEIEWRLHLGEGASKIAREMGVSLHSVQNVKGGRAWRDVPATPRHQP
jgi:hypothetical protein